MARDARSARSFDSTSDRTRPLTAVARAESTASPAVGASLHQPADADPDHHLWRNGRLWWVAFTVIEEGWRQRRVRRSLRTDDVVTARRRRDELMARAAAAEGCEVSLRLQRRAERLREQPPSPRACA